MREHRVIAYCTAKNLSLLRKNDLLSLDIVNIAFGHIEEGRVIWKGEPYIETIREARRAFPGIRFVLSIGGWGSGGFSEAALTEAGRELFAGSAVSLVEQYELDGLDIDWEYPCIGVAGITASREDRVNFTLLLKTVHTELHRRCRGKLLTIAAGADRYFINNTDIKEACRYLDYIQLMTYDLQGGLSVLTGHHTNLYTRQEDLFCTSADHAVRHYMEAGVPAKKLVLGAAFYGRRWEGVPDRNHGLGQIAKTTGCHTHCYDELLCFVSEGQYKRYWDNEAKAPYLFNGTSFISYDDEESIRHKIGYIKERGLMGIMFWEYGCDRSFTLTGFIRKTFDEIKEGENLWLK